MPAFQTSVGCQDGCKQVLLLCESSHGNGSLTAWRTHLCLTYSLHVFSLSYFGEIFGFFLLCLGVFHFFGEGLKFFVDFLRRQFFLFIFFLLVVLVVCNFFLAGCFCDFFFFGYEKLET